MDYLKLSEDEAYTLAPLPAAIRHGLHAVATLAFLSFIFVFALLVYLSWRFVKWHIRQPSQEVSSLPASNLQVDEAKFHEMLAMSRSFTVSAESQPTEADNGMPSRPQTGFWNRIRANPPNQLLVLIYNLLFADFMQATAYFMRARWLALDEIYDRYLVCKAQACIVRNFRPPSRVFYPVLVALWSSVYGMALLGIAISGGSSDFYGQAGEWCWITSSYQELRLYLHHLWIFICLVATSVIYLAIVIHLLTHRKPIASSCQQTSPGTQYATQEQKLGEISSFLAYPLIYILCTVPIATARIGSMVRHEPPVLFSSVAGSLLASAGLLDVLLYSLTRKSIVFSGQKPPTQDTGLETFGFMASSLRTPHGRAFGNMVFIEGETQTHSGSGIRRLWGWVCNLWRTVFPKRSERAWRDRLASVEVPFGPRTERGQADWDSSWMSLGVDASEVAWKRPRALKPEIGCETTTRVHTQYQG
ncbi:hypothetical protein QC764_204430 [Podospora pseudoanserina]|uniref:G protein-coupled receptor GPR1/2/3 C-terminal domain-containing protein n=1 Tax=Podospora pseudoanserina TaxID=2609844 RepID=A0ABR0IGZ8_9PEZI|nr:hypothetical protein QC764_204430 [Podospora pseudoanserina]